VIASHYAKPVLRTIITGTKLRSAPSEAAEEIRKLAPGDPFQMLDESVGWAWGYAGTEGRVGYVETAVLAER
jgi:hypothetical protein